MFDKQESWLVVKDSNLFNFRDVVVVEFWIFVRKIWRVLCSTVQFHQRILTEAKGSVFMLAFWWVYK